MKPELLSPAGDYESFRYALKAGCDAVYLGGPKFSARAYASNFTDEDLKKVIDEAKFYNKKIYITINTLLKDSELYEAYEYAIKVWNMGVDAIIIQDTGLIYLLSKYNEEIELHASTQMTVHNPLGADILKEMNIKRMVLSRELSLEEIKEISEKHETEIFIQGALCISYSGKCLMSSMLSGRSGNRGRCSQSCRMKYSLLDENNNIKKDGFLMSPKDLNTLDILDEIIDTGTASLKIEGRMKRPEYVFETVRQYRNALDGKKWDNGGILQLFNREGSSHAFLKGNKGPGIMAYNSPKNTGLYLGKVNNGLLELAMDLSLGDGVRTENKGFIVTKMTRNGKEIKIGFKGDRVKLFPSSYKNGDVLYKTSSESLNKDIRDSVKEKMEKAYRGEVEIKFRPGNEMELTLRYKDIKVVEKGEMVEKALNNPITPLKIEDVLSKTADTPFYIEKISMDYEEGFVRISSLNELRRKVYERAHEILLKNNRNLKPIEKKYFNQLLEKEHKDINLPSLLVSLDSKIHLEILLKVYGKHLEDGTVIPVINPFMRGKGSLKLKDLTELDNKITSGALNLNYYIKGPEILKSEFSFAVKYIDSLKAVKGIVTDNLGLIKYYKDRNTENNIDMDNSKIKVIGDYKLNILNSLSSEVFHIDGYTLSEELNKVELKNFLHKEDKYLIVYGDTEMMLSEYCPIGSLLGGRGDGPCSAPCEIENYFLQDVLKEKFPLRTDIFCRSYILNSKKKNIIPYMKEIKSMGYKNFRIDFSNEEDVLMKKILDSYLKGNGEEIPNTNTGHYKRGIE